MPLPTHINATERSIAERLIVDALRGGRKVTVDADGEEYMIRASDDYDAILSAMGATSYDVIRVYEADGITWAGNVLLTWGEGDTLIADHTDNKTTHDIVRGAELRAAQLRGD